MSPMSGRMFLIDAQILPTILIKVVQANEMLRMGKVSSIGDAAKAVGISRSAFYRYKNHIRPFEERAHQRIVNLSMELRHESGVLSSVLGTVANHGGNVLTINQGLPVQGKAMASLSVDTSTIDGSFENLIVQLSNLVGVLTLDVVGES